MVRGGKARLNRAAIIPYPLLLVVVLCACTPPAATTSAPIDTLDRPEPIHAPAAAAGQPAASGPDTSATPVAAPEPAASVEDQLAEREREVERLQAEVKEMRAREVELRASLRRVLAVVGEEGATGVNAAQAQAAGALAGARAALAEERERRRKLEAELARLTKETSTVPSAGSNATSDDLAQERQRRHQLEAELERLKQETSTAPYAHNAAGEELLAAGQEVSQLRAALQDERAARERLAEDFRRLQEDLASNAATAESPELRARVEQLEQEKQRITASFTRSLAESQQRTAALERDLALARAAVAATGGNGPAISSVQAENATLRGRLEEEHRRTEELAGKLRMAMRVADLIFKMQSQQEQPQQP